MDYHVFSKRAKVLVSRNELDNQQTLQSGRCEKEDRLLNDVEGMGLRDPVGPHGAKCRQKGLQNMIQVAGERLDGGYQLYRKVNRKKKRKVVAIAWKFDVKQMKQILMKTLYVLTAL